MHGWENPILRKEGIKELKRFIDLPYFLKSKKLLEIFYKYYSEGREHEIQKMMDLHDPSESLENPVDTIGKRRNALDIRLKNYYKAKEGRKAKYQIYFATNKLLGIKEIEGQKEVDRRSSAMGRTKSGAMPPPPVHSVTSKRPFFVIESWNLGSPIGEDRWKYKHLFDEGIIYITLKNVGAEISWIEVSSPHAGLVIECESKAMPTGATTILKLNTSKAWEVIKKGNKNLSLEKALPATLLFKYVTNDGLSGTQTYLYGAFYGSLELQS